jgi:capsular polysaccharide biosynthesis protein
MENENVEMTLELRDIIMLLKKRFLLILCVSMGAAIISGVVSYYYLKPVYETEVGFVVNKTIDKASGSVLEGSDIIMYRDLIKTYSKIALSRTVRNRAIEILEKEKNIKKAAISSQLFASPEGDTQILNIRVRDKVPFMARDYLDAISRAFEIEAKRIYPEGNFQIIDPPELPIYPVSPNRKMNIAIAFFLGLMGAAGIAFLLEFMDSTLKNESAIEKYVGIPVIGVIPKETE